MRKTGRPPKVGLDIKKSIVDLYFVEEAGSDPAAKKHGLFTKLAAYASQRGFALRDTDFSKCDEIREYIDSKFKTAEDDCISDAAFVPINMDMVMTADRQKLAEYLRGRDQYFEEAVRKTARAMKTFRSLNSRVSQLKKENSALKVKLEEMAKDNDNINKMLREKTKECADKTRYIRDSVVPAMANDFEKRTLQTDSENRLLNEAKKTATTPLSPHPLHSIIDLFEPMDTK